MRRRDFLKATVTLTGGLAATQVLNLSGCGGDEAPATEPTADTLAPGAVLLGLYPSSELPEPTDAVRQALAALDFSWLGDGDSVFVKLACNSGNAHPAVTSPAAVTALCEALFARGAGRVVVGDQAGVESVRLAPGEARFSSTQALMEGNGLYRAITAAGAEPHFFDDHGFAEGYFEATLPEGHHWQRPLMLPNVVREVDHIVYLPRLSSHTLAGYTHGLKNAVGWLRDDSRYHLHHDAASLHEKYAEISYTAEIASRLRLVLTFAEQLLLHQGPDTGTIVDVDPRLVIASSDLANHDAFSAALLRHFASVTPDTGSAALAYGEGTTANLRNRFFVSAFVENATGIPWGEGVDGYTDLRGHRYWEGVDADLALARAYALQGGRPGAISVQLDGAPLAGELRAALAEGQGGLFALPVDP